MALSQADWDALKAEMRTLLIQAARSEKTIVYSELAAQLRTATVHYRSPVFSTLLQQLAADDVQAGRPSLATLVVNKATGRPGAGYFKHAALAFGHELDDPEAYWQTWFQTVCDYWQTHEDEQT
jgi:hypothetical protein